MANFLDDTQVEGIDGESERCRAALSPSWAVWGPNGGYVAAIALRAAMARSRLPRPASFHCDFLAVGEFAPVEIRVRSLGGGKRAESLRVEVVQQDRLLLTATAWMVDDGLEGFEHDFAAAPPVPAPGALRSYGDLAGKEYAEWYPIWRSIEGRPVRWRAWPDRAWPRRTRRSDAADQARPRTARTPRPRTAPRPPAARARARGRRCSRGRRR